MDCILVIVAATRLVRIRYLESLSFFHAGKSALYLKFTMQLLVIFHMAGIDQVFCSVIGSDRL